MRKGDIALVVVAVILLLWWLIPSAEGSFVSISVDGKIYKKVPLDTDTEIKVESEWGENTVVIKNGEVYIMNADCPGKLCEKEKISKSAQSIVCLPNRLSVIIEGEKEEIDVII